MQDYLREIEGTLARTKERKNTLLYKLSKNKAEQERLSRLGLREVPSNPSEVHDVKVLKFVLHRIKQDLGDKIARLRNTDLLSLENDGEVVIRAKNDEVNHLVSKKNLWERRLAFLQGKNYKSSSLRKLYFGCAQKLPEATLSGEMNIETLVKGELDELQSEHPSSQCSEQGGTTDLSQIHLEYIERLELQTSERSLLKVEHDAERKLKDDLRPKRTRDPENDYSVDVVLPSEDEIKHHLLEKRKEMLKKRIESLKE